MNRGIEVLASLKVSGGVALTSMASGVSLIIGIIPEGIGKLATFAGFLLSCYMIVYWRKNAAKVDKESAILDVQLETEKLILENARREAEHRRRAEDL